MNIDSYNTIEKLYIRYAAISIDAIKMSSSHEELQQMWDEYLDYHRSHFFVIQCALHQDSSRRFLTSAHKFKADVLKKLSAL